VAAPVVADLCAGSGAIGHAVATERPDATVYLVERYAEALSWLRRNMSDTVSIIVEGDATLPDTMAACNGTCDAVLSNPPYIPLPAAAGMSPEVEADPATALYGGADGLEVIRPLILRARELLRPGGVVGIEHDDTHGRIVPELLREAGFDEVAEHHDLAGRHRFATGRRPVPQD
jgi:release factor glutamine methyltransferase